MAEPRRRRGRQGWDPQSHPRQRRRMGRGDGDPARLPRSPRSRSGYAYPLVDSAMRRGSRQSERLRRLGHGPHGRRAGAGSLAMQSPPASTIPRFVDSPPRAPVASRGGERSASRTHLAACITAEYGRVPLRVRGLPTGRIDHRGGHPPPLFGTAPPIPLFWRFEAAGLSAIAVATLVLPACRMDLDRTLRWIRGGLYVAIAAISLVAVLFP